MKTTSRYIFYILACVFVVSCAPERRTSLGNDSIGVIGYVKPVKQVKGKCVYVSCQTNRNKAEN